LCENFGEIVSFDFLEALAWIWTGLACFGFFKSNIDPTINIQNNPRVSNSLKSYKVPNFKPKLRRILTEFYASGLFLVLCFSIFSNLPAVVHFSTSWIHITLDCHSKMFRKDVLIDQVSLDRLVVSANPKVSRKRKSRQMPKVNSECNGKLLHVLWSVSVQTDLYGKESTKILMGSVDVGLSEFYPNLSTFSEHLRKTIKRLYINSWCTDFSLQMHADSNQWRYIMRTTGHLRENQSNIFLGLYSILIILLES